MPKNRKPAAFDPTARNTGAWLEGVLNDTHKAYELAGVATLSKVAPPVAVIHGPPKRIIMLRNPFVDFTGAWTQRRARSLHMEAKSTSEDKLAINVPDKGTSGLKVSQMDSLRRWHAAGACVGLVWGYMGELRFVSLALLEARLANGAKSILWGHAEEVPPGPGFIMHDWLANLAHAYGLPSLP